MFAASSSMPSLAPVLRTLALVGVRLGWNGGQGNLLFLKLQRAAPCGTAYGRALEQAGRTTVQLEILPREGLGRRLLHIARWLLTNPGSVGGFYLWKNVEKELHR
jgi:hypothetical protein